MAAKDKFTFKPDGNDSIHDGIESMHGGGRAMFDPTDVFLLLLDLSFPSAAIPGTLASKGAKTQPLAELHQAWVQLINGDLFLNTKGLLAGEADFLDEESELRLAPVKRAHSRPFDLN
jgi:hypothetical protein